MKFDAVQMTKLVHKPGPAQQDFEWGGSSMSQILLLFVFFGRGEGGGGQRHATLGKLGF